MSQDKLPIHQIGLSNITCTPQTFSDLIDYCFDRVPEHGFEILDFEQFPAGVDYRLLGWASPVDAEKFKKARRSMIHYFATKVGLLRELSVWNMKDINEDFRGDLADLVVQVV